MCREVFFEKVIFASYVVFGEGVYVDFCWVFDLFVEGRDWYRFNIIV